MIGRIQPSKTSASCMLWQSTSNEKSPEDYVILQELPSTFRKINEHLLKLNWLHKVLCCQEYFLLSRLLVLALNSLPMRPVDNCWAGKTFIWIIKSRTQLLIVLGCWGQQFCLKHLVLMHSSLNLCRVRIWLQIRLRSEAVVSDPALHWKLPTGVWLLLDSRTGLSTMLCCPHPHQLSRKSLRQWE